MRVAIDANAIYTTRAGTARYVRGLLGGLQQLAPSGVEVMPFSWNVNNLAYSQPARALKTAYRELIWARLVAPCRLVDQAADLLHVTGTVPISVPRGVRRVATVLDCAVIRNPARFRRWQSLTGGMNLRRLVEGADKVICISRFTAEEVIRNFQVPAAKLTVVMLGSDINEKPPVQDVCSACSAAIPSEYFLFVGSLEPGKNINLLCRAWELAAEQGKCLPPLVVVGSRWVGVIGEGGAPGNWVYLGYQPDEVLVGLYKNAVGLVFPSQYEGFGLPVLEAMSVGCPVICSRVASLPEVGGEAVMYCDASPLAYLAGMRTVLRDQRLRREMISAGLMQSHKFSWRACAAETLAVYRDVCRV